MQSTLGSDTDEAIGTDTVQPPSNFVPAQKPLSHIAQLKTEAITNWLTRQNLLTAARGGMPRRAAAIKDYPLHLLPPLDPFSPSFAKETAFRLEQVRKNEENQEKRLTIMLEERTKIYGMMVSICEEAVELKRDMLVLCAHHHHADSFDGPRAYQW